MGFELRPFEDSSTPSAFRSGLGDKPSTGRRFLRHALPALLLAGIAASVLGALFVGRASPTKSEAAPELTEVTVKRPLPPGTAEEDVPKWVPMRQTSGRTELAPWNSVDADVARDPNGLQDVLGAKETLQVLPPPPADELAELATEPGTDESASGATEESPAPNASDTEQNALDAESHSAGAAAEGDDVSAPSAPQEEAPAPIHRGS